MISQFQLAYADYAIPPEQASTFRDELLEELLDHQPSVLWQRVTDLGGGKFYVALNVPGDEREAARVLAGAMTKARERARRAAS